MAGKLTDETKAELKRQAGILGESLDFTDTKLVTNIINGSFGSSTFSERLWGNTQYLANSLDTLLTQSIINGRHPNDVARELRRQFDISQKQAERLMRTESARVHAECAVKSMEKNGVTLEITPKALGLIAAEGYDPEFGARPVKRVIHRLILNQLSKDLLAQKVDRSKPIIVDTENDQIVFRN